MVTFEIFSLAREITGVLRAIVGAVSVIIERDENVILASNAPQFSLAIDVPIVVQQVEEQ